MTEKVISFNSLMFSCKRPFLKGNEAKSGLFSFASDFTRAFFGQEQLDRFSQLNIDIFEAVFSNGKQLSLLAEKKRGKITDRNQFKNLERCIFISEIIAGREIAFCRIAKKSGNYVISDPLPLMIGFDEVPEDGKAKYIKKRLEKRAVKIEREDVVISASSKKTQRMMMTVKAQLLSTMLQSAAKDRMFIARFNDEMFYRGNANADAFFESEAANRYVSLSEKPVRTAIIALYAIASKRLTVRDIYDVNAVFSMDDADMQIRGRDKLKTAAAAELTAIISGGRLDEIAAAFELMGRTISQLEAPPLNKNDVTALAPNYMMYVACVNMGAAFIKARSGKTELEEALKKRLGGNYAKMLTAAEALAGYSCALTICQNLLETDFGKRKNRTKPFAVSELEGYSSLAQFCDRKGNAATIGEIKP